MPTSKVARLAGTAAVALTVLILACIATSAQEPSPRTVLTIHWGTDDFPGTAEFNAAIRSALHERANQPVNYYAEYLESETFQAEMAESALRDYIRKKFEGRRVDLVMAIATPALRFALRHRAELFPDVPIVFSANSIAEVVPAAPPEVTGIITTASFAETLELAVRLHPTAKRVFVVARAPATERYDEIVQAALQPFSGRVQLTYLNDPSLARVLAAVRAIPPDSLILYTRYTPGGPGRNVYPDEVARLLVQAAPVPIYSATELYIGTGVVGGMVRNMRTSATRLGEMAAEILDGARPESIPIERVQIVPAFDWRQLQRWAIDPARLPAGSDIRFHAPTVWETYRWHILGTLGVLAAQVLLIATLLVQRARRRRAEGMLRKSEATLRSSYARIRQLAGRLINAQESARAGLAQDLHDDVCQHLVYLSMSVSALKASPGRIEADEAQRAFTELEQDTRCVLDSIRRLSHELHPSALRVLGLGPAVKSHCLEMEKRHGVQVTFSSNNDLRHLNPDVAVCLFRVAQESLRNGITHGHASQFTVTLASSDTHVELTVADNGSGFDLQAVRREGDGLGLVTIEERVNVIGGEVRISSAVGQGTAVHVRCPLEPQSSARGAAAAPADSGASQVA